MMACVQVRVETWACGNTQWGFARHAHSVFVKDEKQRSDVEFGRSGGLGVWVPRRFLALLKRAGAEGHKLMDCSPLLQGKQLERLV